ncbi:hypothetical protein QGN23_14515 [Chryseobacterium gotjawalense]|uniref:DUF4595 domain-containing protein n=1 Tax=Chryseobacterium gotjawalense TaxID=3042315 RepID=A0ABY8RCB0_9FLAO|nr:hypothetical protein [Chryseobacterium sp. wdc7]WHF51617.1 hypothetical protein QGN23_14515 [Chryseobacterium sp. wdc7]
MKVFILLLTFISTIFSAQIREKLNSNDLLINNLKGNVREIKERKYEVNIRNNKITFNTGVLIPESFNYELNRDGFIIYKEGIKNFDGKDKISSKQYFEYKDRKLNREIYLLTEFKDIDTLQWVYKYPNDTVTLKINIKGDFKGLTEKFIQNQNIEISKTFHSENEIIYKKIFVYNNKNRIIQFEEFDIDGKPTEKFTRIVNQNCRDFDSEDRIIYSYQTSTSEFRIFDNKCNIIEKKWKNNSGITTLTLTFKYLFDGEGNWIERKSYNNQNKLFSITTREILYY